MKLTKRTTKLLSILLIFILFTLSGCSSKEDYVYSDVESIVDDLEGELGEVIEEQKDTDVSEESSPSENIEIIENTEESIVDGELEVHFIDVGQGDSILIKQNGHNMLIDAGDNKYGQTVVNYLKENGVKKLDYVIGTHPHADHIGGLDDVIYAFDVEKVFLPNITHTTKTFEDLLIAIQSKNLNITVPEVGGVYELGDASFKILAPANSYYDNLNNFSIVTRLEYGNNSFLFTADAEDVLEVEMLNSGYNLKSDVLKVGHHGSNTSTTASFLNAINPKYTVIQLASNNEYGHPSAEVISRLREKNIEIYRNDLDGTIVAKSDGNSIKFNKKPNSKMVESSAPVQKDKTEKKVVNDREEGAYIGNKNSKIFHKSFCGSLPAEKNRVYFNSVEEALGAGYRGCKKCNP